MPRSWSEAVKHCSQHPTRINGRWCSCRAGWRYRIGLPDPVSGIVGRPSWSQVFPTKGAADRHQRDVRQAIADNTYLSDRGQTIETFLIAWLETKRATQRKASTIDGYDGVIRNHLIPHLGKHRLSELRPQHVQAMLQRIVTEPGKGHGDKGRKPVTPGTLANVRAVLRAALNDAMRQELIGRNVAALVRLPTARREPPVALDDARIHLFMAAAAGHNLERLWFVASVYGMRRAEIAGLRREDIDPKARLIRVRSTVIDVAGKHPCPYCGAAHRRLMFDTPKSLAGNRVYPLVPAVEAALAEEATHQAEHRQLFAPDYTDHGLVFAQPDGTPWRPDWISSEFRRVMVASGAATGLTRVPSLKALRSTMVTNLHEAGMPLEVISRVTGHAGGEVTRTHYLNIAAERTRGEFGALADRFGSQWASRDSAGDNPAPTN